MELHYICETGASNPAIGYNLSPRWQGPSHSSRPARPDRLR